MTWLIRRCRNIKTMLIVLICCCLVACTYYWIAIEFDYNQSLIGIKDYSTKMVLRLPHGRDKVYTTSNNKDLQVKYHINSSMQTPYNRSQATEQEFTFPTTSEFPSSSTSESKIVISKQVVSQNQSVEKGNETCEPIKCFGDLCFENMLCYKLPPLLPQFKNPCFFEQVTQDDSDQNVYKNYIMRRMVENSLIAPVQRFHRLWQSRRKVSPQLRCLPYFFIIGMEKCGTTDMYQRLSMHPEIILNLPKEMQWWTRRRFLYFTNNSFPRGREQSDPYKLSHVENLINVPFKHYYSFFDHIADSINMNQTLVNGTKYHRKITGDGSPNIIYWNDFLSIYNQGRDAIVDSNLVAQHMVAVLPKSKIIIILRNPAERLYSSYLFFNGRPSNVTFHSIVEKGISLFNDCTKRWSLRYCTYNAELKEQVGSTTNLMQGIYSVMMEDWLNVFPRSQIHVTHFETYRRSELDTMNDVFRFLDVETVSKEESLGISMIKKSAGLPGRKYATAGNMLEETNQLLTRFYQPFNAHLVKLLNDTRFYW